MGVTIKIKRFIDVAFKSQRALAQAMNIKPQTLTQYITGNSKPGWEILTKLWNVGCSIDWLITGEGDMFARNEAGDKLRERFLVPKPDKDKQPSAESRLSDLPCMKELKALILEDLKVEIKAMIGEAVKNGGK